jgi:hypothetical protein
MRWLDSFPDLKEQLCGKAEVVASAWHYTTNLDLIDHWQSLIAGTFALVAAGIAVLGTRWIEGGKARAEAEAVRSSIAVECRILLARAYGAHVLMNSLARQSTPITARQIESLAHMPVPVVYPATADRISLLGSAAMDVVAFYGVIEVLVAKANELQRYRTPDSISPPVVGGLSEGFLMACKAGLPLLPKLKTGLATEDAVPSRRWLELGWRSLRVAQPK